MSIRVDISESIATLTIDRPAVRNALNRETVEECLEALGELAGNDEAGAIIFTGSGESAFVSGSDINEIAINPLPPVAATGEVLLPPSAVLE